MIQWSHMSGGLAQQPLPLFQLASTSVCRKTVCLEIFFDGRWRQTSPCAFDRLQTLAPNVLFFTAMSNPPSFLISGFLCFPTSCGFHCYIHQVIKAACGDTISDAAHFSLCIQLNLGRKGMIFAGKLKLNKKLTSVSRLTLPYISGTSNHLHMQTDFDFEECEL